MFNPRIFPSMLFLASLFAAHSTALEGFSDSEELNEYPVARIVGGFKIDIKDVPYQVSLLGVGFGHFCGGSIISKKWILSAAHCTNGRSASDIKVLAGASTFKVNGTGVDLKRIVQHKRFRNKIGEQPDYDYALLELAEPLAFDKSRQPIKLADSFEFIRDQSLCLASGWGFEKFENGESSLHLRAVKLPIVNQFKCAKVFYFWRRLYVTPRMICAGYLRGSKGTCNGDSGGPFVCNNKLFGIVSWGYKCETLSVFARVSTVRSWIKQITGI